MSGISGMAGTGVGAVGTAASSATLGVVGAVLGIESAAAWFNGNYFNNLLNQVESSPRNGLKIQTCSFYGGGVYSECPVYSIYTLP